MAASVTAKAALGQQTTPSTTAKPPAPPVAPGPLPWMQGLMSVKPLPMTPLVPDAVAQTNADFFTQRQMSTLRRLAQVLQPPYKGHPGAVEAGAAEFLDFLIGASPVDRQELYQSGLDRLESEANQRFNKTFEAVDFDQADQLLRPWLRAWMSDHPPTEPFAEFINLAHRDIRTATMNSQAWNEADRRAGRQPQSVDLYWFPVDPDLRRADPAKMRKNYKKDSKN